MKTKQALIRLPIDQHSYLKRRAKAEVSSVTRLLRDLIAREMQGGKN